MRRETQAAHSIVVEVNEAKTKVEAIQVGFDEGIGRIAKANKAMQEVRKAVESSASSVGGMMAAREASVLAETSRCKAEAAESRMLETVTGVERQATQARQSGELARRYADDTGKYAAQARESARGGDMGESPWQARLRQVCGRNEHLLQRANGASRLVLPWLDQGGPEDGQPGGLSGYQTVKTSTKSALVTKKDSPDVQVWPGKGDVKLTCFPAGEDEYAVKVVHLKAT